MLLLLTGWRKTPAETLPVPPTQKIPFLHAALLLLVLLLLLWLLCSRSLLLQIPHPLRLCRPGMCCEVIHRHVHWLSFLQLKTSVSDHGARVTLQWQVGTLNSPMHERVPFGTDHHLLHCLRCWHCLQHIMAKRTHWHTTGHTQAGKSGQMGLGTAISTYSKNLINAPHRKRLEACLALMEL